MTDHRKSKWTLEGHADDGRSPTVIGGPILEKGESIEVVPLSNFIKTQRSFLRLKKKLAWITKCERYERGEASKMIKPEIADAVNHLTDLVAKGGRVKWYKIANLIRDTVFIKCLKRNKMNVVWTCEHLGVHRASLYNQKLFKVKRVIEFEE